MLVTLDAEDALDVQADLPWVRHARAAMSAATSHLVLGFMLAGRSARR